MTEVEILNPAKGHSLMLAAALMCLVFVSAITIATFYDGLVTGTATLSAEQVGWMIILWGAVLLLAVLPGRYVAVWGDEGVSRPTLLPRKHSKLLTMNDIKSYTQATRPRDGEKVRIVVLETTTGRRIRFSDGKTPGCTERVLGILRRWGVPEEHGPL